FFRPHLETLNRLLREITNNDLSHVSLRSHRRAPSAVAFFAYEISAITLNLAYQLGTHFVCEPDRRRSIRKFVVHGSRLKNRANFRFERSVMLLRSFLESLDCFVC